VGDVGSLPGGADARRGQILEQRSPPVSRLVVTNLGRQVGKNCHPLGGPARFLLLACRAVLILSVGIAGLSDTLADSVVRGPYLQSGSPDSIVIRWRTEVPTDSRVVFGFDPADLSQSVEEFNLDTEHSVTLSGLAPESRYYYGVGTTTAILAGGDADHSFVTAPSPGAARPYRIWITGDSGTGDANAAAVRDAYLSFNGDRHTDVWLMLGDNAYDDGSDEDYQRTMFDMYPSLLRRTVLWPVLGNHDGVSADSHDQSGVYYDIFTLPTQGEAGGLASGTEAFYSFDYGNIHFIALDSFDTYRLMGGAMMNWLELDLAATGQEWIIAFWHHPPYSKGSHDSDEENFLIQMRENAVAILDDFGADMTFTGHSHDYERSYLIEGHYGLSETFVEGMKVDGGDGREDGDGVYHKPNPGEPHSGMVHTVAGNAGQVTGGSLDHPVMFISYNLHGSVVLDVDAGRADVTFLDSTGQVLDYFTLLKGAFPQAPVADFSAWPTHGEAPLTVGFTDLAENRPTVWAWDFENDGSIDTNSQNPMHQYVEPGAYAVRQVVENSEGTDQTMREGMICVTAGIPGAVTGLRVDPDRRTIQWQPYPGAAEYDVIKGDLDALPTSSGLGCLQENTAETWTQDDEIPASGRGFYYFVRATNCMSQEGSYDTLVPGQVVSRDAALLGAPNGCGCDLVNDGDADAICDSLDACPDDAANDVDNDLWCAGEDNCPTSFNADQSDVDGDGQGDVCDPCPVDEDNDAEADGHCADVDNCPLQFNPEQLDIDGDGAGDVCDPCPADAANDADLDGHCADVDNCPSDFNADQLDGDGDGLGDVCDGCPQDAANDADADAYCANEDSCPTAYNPAQVDADADAVGNLCDVCPAIYDPQQRDRDADGAGDACDCKASDSNVLPPGAVGQVTANRVGTTGAGLGWSMTPGADTYVVIRGTLGVLEMGSYGDCLAEGIAVTTFDDPDEPPAGKGYFYLLRGESEQCGAGSLGYDSFEQPRPDPGTLSCRDN
jgi:PKD repeat protein